VDLTLPNVETNPLPNAENAVVGRGKVVNYLLSATHPEGRSKARFFSSHGFTPSEWERLATALVAHAAAHGVMESEVTSFGIRYIVEGRLQTPSGRRPIVRVVWFVQKGRDVPELVTAYPMRRRS
jgi:hypothetical protein